MSELERKLELRQLLSGEYGTQDEKDAGNSQERINNNSRPADMFLLIQFEEGSFRVLFKITSLIIEERIKTSLARAKAARSAAEKIVTKGKKDSVNARRQVAKYVYGSEVVQKVSNELGPRYADRNGGYTLGPRRGDVPGMNACIRATIRRTLNRGLSISCIRKGYEGLIDNDFMSLQSSDVSNIIQRGGTILHTARSERFLTVEGRSKAAANLEKRKVEGLVVIGGDGSSGERMSLQPNIRYLL